VSTPAELGAGYGVPVKNVCSLFTELYRHHPDKRAVMAASEFRPIHRSSPALDMVHLSDGSGPASAVTAITTHLQRSDTHLLWVDLPGPPTLAAPMRGDGISTAELGAAEAGSAGTPAQWMASQDAAVASAVAKLPPSTLVLTLAMAQGPSSNSVAREHGVVFVAMT
jgi:hypothetical protein